MREYSVDVNETQAKRVALDIARDDTSIIWLVKLIDTAFDNVIRQVGAFDRLNNALGQRGYRLNIIPERERPAKACRPVVEDKETIGARIKRLRIAKNWSQTDLAERIGWTQGTVSMFERSRQTPSSEGLSQLADAFGTSIAVIAGVQTDNTPMTETTFLGRKHPVVDGRATKPSKALGISRRFQEQDEDDDLPTARDLQRGKKYEPVDVTGPQVLAIIQFNSISIDTLRDSFEVTPEEYERIREQQWADFGRRWMHELHTDLVRMYTQDKQREALATPKVNIVLGNKITDLLEAQLWLNTKEELLNQGFDEVDIAQVLDCQWAKFTEAHLNRIHLKLEGVVAQRNAPAPNDDKRLRPKRLLKPAQMIRSQLVEELNQHFTTHAWLTKEELVANFEMGEDEYDWIVSLNHTKLGVTELRMYVTDIRGAIAERAIEVSQEAK